jgi:hypothetical protein
MCLCLRACVYVCVYVHFLHKTLPRLPLFLAFLSFLLRLSLTALIPSCLASRSVAEYEFAQANSQLFAAVHTRTHTNIHRHAHIHVHTHRDTHTHIHSHTHRDTHTHIHSHTHKHTQTHTNTTDSSRPSSALPRNVTPDSFNHGRYSRCTSRGRDVYRQAKLAGWAQRRPAAGECSRRHASCPR